VSDFTAFVIAALVTAWLDAPLWVWLPLAIASAIDALASLGGSD
jgi:hypothetical protein